MIFVKELQKLLHNRAFLLIFVIALCLNIYIAYTADSGYSAPDSSYKAYLSDVENMTLTEAKSFTESYYNKVQETNEPIYSEYYWLDLDLLRKQIGRIAELESYPDFLESINTAAKTMTTVSIFADKGSFSYRNIIKTPSAYEDVRSIQPILAPSEGVKLATDNPASDILTLFAIFACVSAVFYKDRESGITALIKPLKYGRTRLALTKTALIFAVCLFTEAMTFASNIVIGSIRFGLGDLARPVQSLEGYIGCNFPINVTQMLLLSFAIKLFGMFLCATIAQCLFIRLSNTMSYVCIIGVSAVEAALFLLIAETSVFSPLKQINLTAYVNSARLFKTYSNINFFGYPINLIGTSLICIAVFTAAFIALICRLYSTISISEVKRSTKFVFSKKIPTSLFGYTAYKQLITHKGAIILAAVLAIQLYTAVNYHKPYNPDDTCYYGYCAEIFRMTDSEADEFITSEDARFEALMTGQIVSDNNELQSQSGYEKAKTQYQHIKSLGYGTKEMFYQTGYKALFGIDGLRQDYILGLIAIAALCLMLSPLIAYDNSCRIGYIIYTTRAGKRTYFRYNCIMSSIMAVTASTFVYIPYFVQMLKSFGTDGLTSSVRCIYELAKLPNISVLAYLILIFVYRTVILLIISQLLILISAKCQSPAAAIIITLAVFCLPIVTYLAGAEPAEWLCPPISGNREILRLLS